MEEPCKQQKVEYNHTIVLFDPDLLGTILMCLHPLQIYPLSRVCKQWKLFLESDSFWKAKVLKLLPSLGTLSNPEFKWKNWCGRKFCLPKWQQGLFLLL